MSVRACVALVVLIPAAAFGQDEVRYRVTFPAPQHRWMQVEATFTDLPAGSSLQLRMSRSSPGRYALHEFAKNVFDVRITDGAGRVLQARRPDAHGWDVTGHDGSVRVTYKVFGDRVDGTYLAVDSTHAHINMPAALMWARGLEQRPAMLHFEPPPGAPWKVATQLAPGAEPYTFTAPNLQYLMDSPAELSAFALRTFVAGQDGLRPEIRIALHHAGTDAELDVFARDAERIVREMKHVFGEYPRFDHNAYTFIADYLPWAENDGMEHRNSTVLTSPAGLSAGRESLLGTLSHEFFHAWNAERIRPQSLEPFRFDEANVSGELWFAEGFTSYYGPLVMRRAGLSSDDVYAQAIAEVINAVALGPGRHLRSAEEMSRLAPFVDAAAAIDRTAFQNTFISYYTWGAALGLALDLSLRDRTDGRVTLDDVMREMWQQFGKSAERVPGYVERPYTMADLESVLASVSADSSFARDFFARYIQGHEIPDYPRLLGRAGFRVAPVNPGRAWLGDIHAQTTGQGAHVTAAVPFGSPAYEAGIERDDTIVSIAGRRLTSGTTLHAVMRDLEPGQPVAVVFERRGRTVSSVLRPVEDPRIEVVASEAAGKPVTSAQRQFRATWLSSQADRVLKNSRP